MTMRQAYLDDLRDIVNIDSQSCDLPGLRKVAETLKAKFEAIGCVGRIDHIDDRAGDCLFVTNKPDAETFDIMMDAHMDTVFPHGTAAERPFSYDDVKAYGPGALDCKGGCVMMLHVLKNTPKEVLDKLAICITCNSDEEILTVYSTPWLQSFAKRSKCALIYEPARKDGELVCARKAASSYEFVFHGKASHAGVSPETGCDAVMAMVKFISAVKSHENRAAGIVINCSPVEGGQTPTTIADYARCQFRFFAWTNEDHDRIRDIILDYAKKEWEPGVTIDVRQINTASAMTFNDETKSFAAMLEEAARRVDVDVKWIRAGGLSDGNRISAVGIPTLDGLGPSGFHLHNNKEYLDLKSIDEHIRMSVSLLTMMAEQKS